MRSNYYQNEKKVMQKKIVTIVECVKMKSVVNDI